MSKKEDNAKQAEVWLGMINNHAVFRAAIENSKEKSFARIGQLITEDEWKYIDTKADSVPDKTHISFIRKPTYEVALDCYGEGDRQICVLNFASYFKPGGGFLKGSYAQEESLCHVSGLYPILDSMIIYKARAKRKDMPETYLDEVIYSPAVPFTMARGSITAPVLFDVISCAAPNCNRVPISKARYVDLAITNRIEAIVTLPYLNGCDTLILGAWGCGVFRNNPEFVAKVFAKTLQSYGKLYKKVVFALPNEDLYKLFEANI